VIFLDFFEKEMVAKLSAVLEYEFKCPEHLLVAVTHPSYRAEQKVVIPDNQRMEFLGDAVIELIVSEKLYEMFPNKNEGGMSQMRSAVTNKFPLSKMGRTLGLPEFIRLSKGEQKADGAERESTLCDAFEAVVAAIYLDGGFSAASTFFWSAFKKCGFDLVSEVKRFNPKGAIQEYTQKMYKLRPEYVLEKVEGPEHDPVYSVSLKVNGETWASGTGTNRKQAEIAAAEAALETLSIE
jgi:ribonuclease-3